MSLLISLPDDEWTYLPLLQGKRTNLLVGISLHRGEVVALAQFSSYGALPHAPGCGVEPRVKEDWYCLGWNTDGAGRILTMSRAAVEEGQA